MDTKLPREMTVAELQEMNPFALAKMLNKDDKPGLNRDDLELAFPDIQDPGQRKLAVDGFMGGLKQAFAGTGIEIRDESANTLPKFNLAAFDRDVEFRAGQEGKKVKQFIEFAKEGNLAFLDKDSLQKIHHVHFRSLQEAGVTLDEQTLGKLRQSQLDSYQQGKNAPYITRYDPSQMQGDVAYGAPRVLDESPLVGAHSALNDLARHGWNLNADPSLAGDATRLARKLDLNKDGKLTDAELKTIYNGSDQAAKSLAGYLQQVGIRVEQEAPGFSNPMTPASSRSANVDVNQNIKNARSDLGAIAANGGLTATNLQRYDPKDLQARLDVDKNGLDKADLAKIYGSFTDPAKQAEAVEALTSVLRKAGVTVAENNNPATKNIPYANNDLHRGK